MDVSTREQGTYRFGPFRLDPVRRLLRREGEKVKLAERLFDLLHYLVTNPGRVAERDELLQVVWAGRTVEDSNLGQAISALRKVLQAGEVDETFIVTVPGRGFRFAAPVVFEPDPLPCLLADEHGATSPWPGPGAHPAVPSPWRARAPLIVAALAFLMASTSILLWRSCPKPGDGAEANAPFTPPPHSVAVLAFENMSSDPALSYLSDGLSEQVIDSLTQIDPMRVAARTSTFSFRGSHATVHQIARALNVGAILAGSVRRTSTRVTVTVQLTNALTGFNIWSRTYDRDQNQLVNVQAEIALAVAQSMDVALPGDEQARLTLGGTSNVPAYDAYLHGMNLRRNARNEADYRAALAEFDRALALDPGFALGYAKRAITLVAVISLGTGNAAATQHLVQQAQEAADRAVALSPMLGAAHSARGAVLGHLLLDHAGAFDEQVKARALSPGDAAIENNYASAALALGHVEEAVTADRRAVELDPLDSLSWGQLGHTLYEGHRYREALVALDRERTVVGSLPLHHDVLRALVLLMMGQSEAARTICAAGRDWQENQLLALADHALGRQAEAEADLKKLRAALGSDAASNSAEIYAQWGQKAEALRWFGIAVQSRDPGLLDVLLDPLLDPIRGEPQFKVILARIGSPSLH